MRSVPGLGGSLVIVLILLGGPGAVAEEAVRLESLPLTDQAAAVDLSEKTLARLAQDGFVLTDRTFRQVFHAYLDADLPVFVTADAVLNAYQVLLEETLLRVETDRASDLGDTLSELWKGIDETEPVTAVAHDTLERAKDRLRIVLGTAMRLLEIEVPTVSVDVRESIEDEVERVLAERGISRPPWLPAEEGPFPLIDYGEFRPRGVYAQTEELGRYFRATRFLQMIPFRIHDDVELVAATLLAMYIRSEKDSDEFTSQDRCRHYLDDLDDLLPRSDHLTLSKLSWEAYGKKRSPLAEPSLAPWRVEVEEDASEAVLTDHVDVRAARPSLRILPAARLPDAVLLRGDEDPDGDPKPGRLGLLVGAALGSPLAVDLLTPSEAGRLESNRAEWGRGQDLYRRHLQCLASLVADPEPDAPDLFKTEAWRWKSLQTALAGWAQLRHAWVLHSKPNGFCACATIDTPGFVEPVPAFYASMRRQCTLTRDVLGAAFYGSYARVRMASQLAAFLKTLPAERDLPEQAGEGRADLEGVDRDGYRRARYVAEYYLGIADADDLPVRELAGHVRPVYEQLAGGSRLPEKLQRYVNRSVYDLEAMWKSLEHGCLYLELLAHKQLRGAEFSAEEKEWIRDFGKHLAGWMFYDETSAPLAPDDAPRIVDVVSRPRDGLHDHVGIGRPQALYIAYPWRDGHVLCQGAVLPYVEVRAGERLTDAAWRDALGDAAVSDDRRPKWLRLRFLSTAKPTGGVEATRAE